MASSCRSCGEISHRGAATILPVVVAGGVSTVFGWPAGHADSVGGSSELLTPLITARVPAK